MKRDAVAVPMKAGACSGREGGSGSDSDEGPAYSAQSSLVPSDSEEGGYACAV